MIPFLEQRKYIYEKLKANVDHHASDFEYTEFKKLADKISPNNKFTWQGCHSCGQALMKFVFENESKIKPTTKENQNDLLQLR